LRRDGNLGVMLGLPCCDLVAHYRFWASLMRFLPSGVRGPVDRGRGFSRNAQEASS